MTEYILNLHEMTWRNIRFLGLPNDINELQKLNKYNALINTNNFEYGVHMFDRSNTNGLLVILHMLLSKIYPFIYSTVRYRTYTKANFHKFNELNEIFRLFELNNNKTNQNNPKNKTNIQLNNIYNEIIEAKKCIQYLLNELYEIGIIPIGLNRTSLIHNSHGEAPYVLIWRLSFYLMTKLVKRRYPMVFNRYLNDWIGDFIDFRNEQKDEKIERNEIINEINESNERMSAFSIDLYKKQQYWKGLSEKISNKIFECTEEIDILSYMNDELKEKTNQINENILSEMGQIERQENIEKCRRIWDMINQFIDSSLLKKTENLLEHFELDEIDTLQLSSSLLDESSVQSNISVGLLNIMTNWKKKLRAMELTLIKLYPTNKDNNINTSNIIDLELRAKNLITEIKDLRENISYIKNESDILMESLSIKKRRSIDFFKIELENELNLSSNMSLLKSKNRKNIVEPPTPPTNIYNSPPSFARKKILKKEKKKRDKRIAWQLRRRWEESNQELQHLSILHSDSPKKSYLLTKS